MRPTMNWSYGNLALKSDADRQTGTGRHSDPAPEPLAAGERPTLPDVVHAIDEHGFFADGDAGRYPGGPATLAPVAFDEPEEEEIAVVRERTPEQRRRHARLVRFVVVTLGGFVGLLTVGVIRAHLLSATPVASHALLVAPRPAARSVWPALHVSDLPAPQPAAAPQPTTVATASQPAVVAAPHPAVAAAPRARPAPAQGAPAVKPRASESASAARRRAPHVTRAHRAAPAAVVPVRSEPSHDAVPTASFPTAVDTFR